MLLFFFSFFFSMTRLMNSTLWTIGFYTLPFPMVFVPCLILLLDLSVQQ
jgi:hypothetical protein